MTIVEIELNTRKNRNTDKNPFIARSLYFLGLNTRTKLMKKDSTPSLDIFSTIFINHRYAIINQNKKLLELQKIKTER